MKLNRNNYEEYFILYLDNELSSEDRREVDIFANENPDLKAELDMLLQSKLSPNTDIIFQNKELLMARTNSAISMNNYEEWLLFYTDNELTAEEIKEVETFVAEHPSVKKELGLLQQTKLQPDEIVFPDKESLYRKEEKVRVVAIKWLRIAAAAVLLIGISTTAIVILNKKTISESDMAIKVQPKIETSKDRNDAKQPENITPSNLEAIAGTESQKIESPVQHEPRYPVTAYKRKTGANEKNLQAFTVKPEETSIAKSNIEKKPDNHLPRPDLNPAINGSQDNKQNEVIAAEKLPAEILTNPDKKTDIGAVTASTLEPSDPIEQPDGKKNKLRGFFRKVTRTFEKRTNMKATGDDDDRLLIAGLAIKLN